MSFVAYVRLSVFSQTVYYCSVMASALIWMSGTVKHPIHAKETLGIGHNL